MPRLPFELAHTLHVNHLNQLAQQEIPGVDDLPEETAPPFILSDALDWIKANPAAIAAAKKTQCDSSSVKSPNWDAILFSLIESSAMYLRKPDEMIEAIRAAKANDYETAIEHLKLAQADIDSIAKALDCTFIQLCDFSRQSPEGTFYHSGAFCGVFISNDTSKPFMGLGFKGSNSLRDFNTDLDWTPIAPIIEGVAWGAKIHRGFYEGLFGQFKVGSSFQIPYNLIEAGLTRIYSNEKNKSLLHFTGHSLGGAYCTITYGEFLRRQATPPTSGFKFGDMYALAAPRVCLEPFASNVNSLGLLPGTGKYLFRIVNYNDPVTTVPPRTKAQLPDYPFIHVGGAWELYDDKAPAKMADEPPPVDPMSFGGSIWNIKHHQLSDYYASWQRSPHTK